MPGHASSILTAGLSLLALTKAQSFDGNYSTISNVSSSACPGEGGAHIIVARASTEPLGYGIIGAVKDAVIRNNSASNAEYVDYPATLTDYFNSESAGVLGMRSLVEAYLVKDCPNRPPIVLMGYSQGAQVVADYLSGQSDKEFPYNSSLADRAPVEVTSRIAAVITMGDPSINITDNAAHVGNSTKPGIFERVANASMILDSLAEKTQAYCDALDPYCASAGTFKYISVHIGYVKEYGHVATEFVNAKIVEYYAGGIGVSGSNMTTNGTMSGGAGGMVPMNGTSSGAGAMSPTNGTSSGSGSSGGVGATGAAGSTTPTQSGSQSPAYTGAAAGMRAGSAAALVMAVAFAFACAL